jgi:hypothetical protein
MEDILRSRTRRRRINHKVPIRRAALGVSRMGAARDLSAPGLTASTRFSGAAALGRLDGAEHAEAKQASPTPPGPGGPAPRAPAPLTIVSATRFTAADGTTPNSRRTIGLGETIEMTTNRRAPATWTVVGGASPPAPAVQHNAAWTSAGTFNVTARVGRQTATASITVVAPTMSPVKHRNLTLAQAQQMLRARGIATSNRPNRRGVFMEVVVQLMPATVSFGALGFREVAGPATNTTGWYRARSGRAAAHSPATGFAPVRVLNHNNVVGIKDIAGFSINPQGTNLPVTQGGFDWVIPAEVRAGASTVRLPTTMTQTHNVAPNPDPITRPPLTGTFTVTKGGASNSATF